MNTKQTFEIGAKPNWFEKIKQDYLGNFLYINARTALINHLINDEENDEYIKKK